MMKKYSKVKDSCIPWIGNIPEKWDVQRLKFSTNFELSTVDRHEFDEEIPVSICHYPQVYNNEKINSNTVLEKGTCTKKELEKFQLKKDDVIITKDSETPDEIGVPVYIEENMKDAVCGYHLAQLVTDKKQLLGEYLFRFLQSSYANVYFKTQANGVTRYGLGKDSIWNLKILIPPLEEQHQIINFLKNKLNRINSLISNNKLKHEVLFQYQQSLITSAVTGKIDVRGAVA